MESTERLVLLAQAGNLEAFGSLVERYEHAAIAVALPIVGDFHHAQDVAQECFVSAYRSLSALCSPKAFGPWLLTSAARRARRVASSKSPISLGHDLEEVLASSAAGSANHCNQSKSMDELFDILPSLSKLPEHELEFVNLRYFGGLSAVEISAALGRPVGTVTKQLSRAIQRLQQLTREPLA